MSFFMCFSSIITPRYCKLLKSYTEALAVFFLSRCLSQVWVKSDLTESNLSQNKTKKASMRSISCFATKVRICSINMTELFDFPKSESITVADSGRFLFRFPIGVSKHVEKVAGVSVEILWSYSFKSASVCPSVFKSCVWMAALKTCIISTWKTVFKVCI